MNSSTSLTMLVVGLTLGVSALAQAPPPSGPPPSFPPPQTAMESPVTQSSRIRAFNPGPDGQLRSLYLANGSVVNLPPDLGRTMSAVVRKGERVSVSGLRSNVNGQMVLAASSVTLNGQTFVSQPGSGPIAGGERNVAPPPPPPGGPNRGRGPRGGPDMARLGPQGSGTSAPGQAPPPPGRPDAARPQGNQPPPPPEGSRTNAPAPALDSNAPAQPNAAPAPRADQPVAPAPTPPMPNGTNR